MFAAAAMLHCIDFDQKAEGPRIEWQSISVLVGVPSIEVADAAVEY